MKMKRARPPAFAVWLLRGLSPSKTGEAIAGDLAEQFDEHRSTARFWRETLVAILAGVPQILRRYWPEICVAFGVAALDDRFMKFFWKNDALLRVYTWGVSTNFPLSTAFDFGFRAATEALLVLPVLIIFLVFLKTLKVRTVLGVLVTFFMLMAFGDLGVSSIAPKGEYWICRFLFVSLLCLWLSRPFSTQLRTQIET
jgi:hypothetical protein